MFCKYSSTSFNYIQEFIKNYHSIIGNKFFPCVYIQTETSNSANYSTEISRKQINNITKSGSFPLIKIINNFNKNECKKTFNKILNEIEKEKNDEFPYNVKFDESLQFNYCIKNYKIINIINIFLLIFAIVNNVIIIVTYYYRHDTGSSSARLYK